MIMQSVLEFINCDEAYLEWLKQYEDGFVVNTRRTKDGNYMVLHRATCRSISQYTGRARAGGFTERDYIKVCSANILSLRNWVHQHGRSDGSFTNECPLCRPLQGRETS